VTATMCSEQYALPEVIHGHAASILFTGDGFDIKQEKLSNRPAPPGANQTKAEEGVEHVRVEPPRDDTRAFWQHFLECVRSRNPETLCTADTGYAAIATVNMGVRSYREGKALLFDKGTGEVCEADTSWARRWEERSKLRGKPNQVIGWHAGTEGSLLEPPAYQKLEGDWIDDKDPAEKA